jgi:hypothetical protein
MLKTNIASSQPLCAFSFCLFCFSPFSRSAKFALPVILRSPGAFSFVEAAKHAGTTDCVTGTMLHIENGPKGVTFVSFCNDAKTCPFSFVVFPSDIKKMGDIRQLEGKQIEIKGTIQDYHGHAEIVLRRTQQLGNGAFLVFPPVPTDYDIAYQGHNSAAKFVRPKIKKTELRKAIRFRLKILESRSRATGESHHSLSQFIQRILCAAPHDSIVRESMKHRAQQCVHEQDGADRM